MERDGERQRERGREDEGEMEGGRGREGGRMREVEREGGREGERMREGEREGGREGEKEKFPLWRSKDRGTTLQTQRLFPENKYVVSWKCVHVLLSSFTLEMYTFHVG